MTTLNKPTRFIPYKTKEGDVPHGFRCHDEQRFLYRTNDRRFDITPCFLEGIDGPALFKLRDRSKGLCVHAATVEAAVGIVADVLNGRRKTIAQYKGDLQNPQKGDGTGLGPIVNF